MKENNNMNWFRLLYCMATLAFFAFFGCAVAMFVSFGLCYKLNPNVYNLINVQGGNGLDLTRWFLLGFAIACLLFMLGNVVIWCFLRQLMSNKKQPMVGELMYILGLAYVFRLRAGRSPSTVSSKSTISADVSLEKSPLSSKSSEKSTATFGTESIMGLGYDDQQLWTYRGKRPYPLKEPTDREEI